MLKHNKRDLADAVAKKGRGLNLAEAKALILEAIFEMQDDGRAQGSLSQLFPGRTGDSPTATFGTWCESELDPGGRWIYASACQELAHDLLKEEKEEKALGKLILFVSMLGEGILPGYFLAKLMTDYSFLDSELRVQAAYALALGGFWGGANKRFWVSLMHVKPRGVKLFALPAVMALWELGEKRAMLEMLTNVEDRPDKTAMWGWLQKHVPLAIAEVKQKGNGEEFLKGLEANAPYWSRGWYWQGGKT